MSALPKMIPVSSIRLDTGIQSRERINEDYVQELANLLTEGKALPPVEVFEDGTYIWMADGFHRALAHARIGLVEIEANVNKGTQKDAIWHSCSANQSHGLRRTNADKRRAVEMALKMKPELSDRGLAEHVGVNSEMVGGVRRLLSETDTRISPPERIGKDGRKYHVSDSDTSKSHASSDDTPRSAKPPPPPKVRVFPKDTKGKEIPNGLIPLWSRRDEVKGLINNLNEIKRVLKKAWDDKDPLYAGGKMGRSPFDYQHAEAKLSMLINDLYAAYPVRVCPACKGETCRACCGLGLISDFYLKTIPESIRGK